MGTGLSQACAHFEERKDDDARCVIFMFLQSRRREATFTLGPRKQGTPVADRVGGSARGAEPAGSRVDCGQVRV